jgi:hypothetical protein
MTRLEGAARKLNSMKIRGPNSGCIALVSEKVEGRKNKHEDGVKTNKI